MERATLDYEREGFASYPHRLNYPKPGTKAEADWLAGWYKAERQAKIDAIYGNETFANFT